MPKNSNVVATPTKPNGNQGWKCNVCGEEMSYTQPINFEKMLDLLGSFMDAHIHEDQDQTL